MKNKKVILQEGQVIEMLPNSTFKVKISGDDRIVLCHLSGKMRMNFIKVLPGDTVKVEFSPYDFSRGRIIYRY